MYGFQDVNHAYDYFLCNYCEDFNKFCPKIRKKVVTFVNHKTWLTRGLINACHKKNKLYKSYLKTKSPRILCKYNRYKNKLTSILRIEEKKYYDNSLSESVNNVKETWRILNGIINKKRSVNSDPDSSKENGCSLWVCL